MKGYPHWFSKFLISLIVISLFVSGFLLIPGALDAKLQVEMPWKLSGDLRIINTAFHTLLSFLAFFLLGSLWSIHMRREWNRHKKRLSGSLLVILFFLLCFSALGLLYVGNEKLAILSSLAHVALGLIFLFIYITHIFF